MLRAMLTDYRTVWADFLEAIPGFLRAIAIPRFWWVVIAALLLTFYNFLQQDAANKQESWTAVGEPYTNCVFEPKDEGDRNAGYGKCDEISILLGNRSLYTAYQNRDKRLICFPAQGTETGTRQSVCTFEGRDQKL